MKRNTSIILITMGIVVVAAFAIASVPHLINYQGVLTDSGGVPISGTHDLTFTIYPDSAVSATAYWAETHTGVQFDDGLFHVILGGTTPIPDDLFASPVRWIGITVDATPEMKPRLQITSVPWALHAAVADTVLSGGGVGDGHSLDAADGDPVDALYVNDLGYVGIGTTSPMGQLDVRLDRDMAMSLAISNHSTGNNSKESLRFRDENGNTAHITAYDINDPSWPGRLVMDNDRSGGSIWFRTNGADRLSIFNNGNIGIGVASATEKLQIAGTVHSTTGGFRFPDGTVQTTAGSGSGGLSLPFADSASVGYSAFIIANENAGGGAIKGENTANNNVGYLGHTLVGVYGISPTAGVRGFNDNGNYGSLGAANIGVYGQHFDGNYGQLGGSTYGASGINANGHYGYLGADTYGAYGRHANGNRGYLGNVGYGVAGYSDTVAVHGYNSDIGNYGRLGTRDHAVYGRYTNGNVGILGALNLGAYGAHANGNYGYLGGTSYGVYGEAAAGGYGGYFAGRVCAEDTIHSATGGFQFPDGTVQTTAVTGGGDDGDWGFSGNDIYSAVSGNVGIGTTSPVVKLNVASGRTVLFGADTTGAGNKLMWLPSKAAFRAGYVTGGEWDWANIGIGSTAMGINTTASGYSSTAMGLGTTASGNASTAMGSYTTVPGNGSTAMGYATKAESQYSTAIGTYNVGGGTPNAWVDTDPLFEIGRGTSGTPANAMTVLKNGNVGIGTSAPGDYDTNADDLVVYDTPNSGMTIASAVNSIGSVYFADGTGGADAYRGFVQYRHGSYGERLSFGANGTEVMSLKDGNVGIGTPAPEARLHVKGGGYLEAQGASDYALEAFHGISQTNAILGHPDYGVYVETPYDPTRPEETTWAALGGSSFGVSAQSNANDAVWAYSSNGRAIHGASPNGTAGEFDGDVVVNGGAYRGDIGPNGGAPFPRPAYDSGWESLSAGESKTLTHGVDGNELDYVVDFWTYGVDGISNSSQSSVVNWTRLTSSQISVSNLEDIPIITHVRVRIWVYR